MAIERVEKVAIFGMAQEFPRIARGLQRLSMLHIERIETVGVSRGADDTLADADDRLSRAEAGIEALKPYAAKKGGIPFAKPQLTEAELLAADAEEQWRTVERALSLTQGMPLLRARIAQAKNADEALAPYEKLTVRVGDIRSEQHVFMALGTVQEASYEKFLDEAALFEAVVQSIDQKGDMRAVFIACHKSQREGMDAAMRSAGFIDAALGFEGTVGEEQRRLRAEMAQAQAQLDDAQRELAVLAKDMASIELLRDCCAVKRQRAALALDAGHTQQAFYLCGWVRERHVDELRERLEALSEGIAIEIITPEADEKPPTAMRNGRLLRPFEAVTEMFSAPSPYEADPTWMMAPFFLCFFGLMLADAAYGIALTALALLMLKLVRPAGRSGQIVAVLAMCGVATLLWGILFGSWFGESFLPALWFNPMDDPMLMLLLCLGIGLVHISCGILMKGIALVKERRYLAVVFDCGFILCVLWGAVAALLGARAGLTVLYVGIAGMFLTGGRDRPGILKKFVGGFSEVYGLSGYLSDVLSYARLFGMGIATGVISMVFNTIAGMLMGNIVGIVFASAVLFVGHTFNFAINALGAYVHACRLQYIEFYNKFYEGGGRVFTPYAFKTKYTQLIRG
jgi:V/A-type H+-transporting ATPase subunit I